QAPLRPAAVPASICLGVGLLVSNWLSFDAYMHVVVAPLVWGGFCQGGAARVLTIFLSVSFFVRPGNRFFIPTYTTASPARAEAVKDGRVSAHRRLDLEGFEHDGTLERVGMMTYEGSPRVVDELRPHACMRWARDPDHDAVMRIAAKLRGGGPILYHGNLSHADVRDTAHLEPSSATRRKSCGQGPKPSGGVVRASLQWAGRRTTPSGTTPSRTKCHRAMSSLRAKATIIFLREPFFVRASNHLAKALSFW